EGMKSPSVSFAGKTSVREMMALVDRCRLFITNDSGPMHVASALGVPVVAVYGPTDPSATPPSGPAAVVRNKVECAPCVHRECPIDHRCMEGVSAGRVLEEAERLMKSGAGGSAAVFLDRDGTIIRDVGHLSSLDQLSLIPGAARAVGRLNRAGVRTILVTNQSGVARGLFTEAFLDEAHRRLQTLLAKEGARLDRIYYCPHHPDFMRCDCRKPEMGMVERAVREGPIDLARSYVVGDKSLDIALARGGAKGVLVRTGYGESALQEISRSEKRPDHVALDLSAAVEWILDDIQKRDRR
ncbi:MAG TPA: HAD-IIIA family hydrolase, partial [Candidatus Manganitrophaceae bacterium]